MAGIRILRQTESRQMFGEEQEEVNATKKRTPVIEVKRRAGSKFESGTCHKRLSAHRIYIFLLVSYKPCALLDEIRVILKRSPRGVFSI